MPWIVIALPFIAGTVYILMKFYIKTYRELTRLESVTHSPILTHLGETLSGSTTIRNYQKNDDFIEDNYSIMNINLNAAFWKGAVRRWFVVRLEITGRLIVVISLILMVSFLSLNKQENIIN